jgi:hypothetical protein
MPTTNIRRRPSRSAARPPSSSRPPKLSRYALSTHCRSPAEKPRSALIEGNATRTIAESRMTMKKAVHSSVSAFQRRGSGGAMLSTCVRISALFLERDV